MLKNLLTFLNNYALFNNIGQIDTKLFTVYEWQIRKLVILVLCYDDDSMYYVFEGSTTQAGARTTDMAYNTYLTVHSTIHRHMVLAVYKCGIFRWVKRHSDIIYCE